MNSIVDGLDRWFANQRRRCEKKARTVRRTVRRRRMAASGDRDAAGRAMERPCVDTYAVVGLAPLARRLDELDGEAQD